MGLTCRLHAALPRTWSSGWIGRTRLLSTRQSSLTTTTSDVSNKKPDYITTPIFYVNGAPHLGHVFSVVVADTLARWSRLSGRSCVFMTGTDEHGSKVMEAAAKKGLSPSQFCDDVSESFRSMFEKVNASNDDFLRTTQERHAKRVKKMWSVLKDKGFIYKGTHEGWYCKSDEAFVPETQLIRVESAESSTGAQWRTEAGHSVEWISEENYKFKLSAFQDKLLEWLEKNPETIYPPGRYNETVTEIKGGLHDVSVSRLADKVSWAVSVPDDPVHSVYVWLDALTVYLTGAGYPVDSEWESAGSSTHAWPADCHVLGKDILRFHAIYWPAFLMAAGLPLPKKLLIHSHWTVERRKMSKSLGNVVDPSVLVDTYGVDAVRYFLLNSGGVTNDGDFSEMQLIKGVYLPMLPALPLLFFTRLFPITRLPNYSSYLSRLE